MHSLVGLDATPTPITPLLTWADDHAAEQATRLRDPALTRRTGTPMHPMSPLAKLVWWRETDPATFAAVRCWVGVKELVLHALTGELLTDHGTASGTGLRNLDTGAWDAEALALAGLSQERLPRLVDGTQTVPLTAQLGLPAGTPVVVGGADGPLANLGLGAIRPGDVACSIGTSGAVRAAVDRALGRSRRAHLLLRPGTRALGRGRGHQRRRDRARVAARGRGARPRDAGGGPRRCGAGAGRQ